MTPVRPRRFPTRSLGAATALYAALAIGFAPAVQAQGEYEPNDTRETAYGPLQGGVEYRAQFETTNDVDWYVFYVRRYSQMDISGSVVDDPDPDSRIRSARVTLTDTDGKYITGLYIYGSTEQHMRRTLNAGRYYLLVENDRQDPDTVFTGEPYSYRFRIDPTEALTPSMACGEAIVNRDAAAPELARVNRQLKKNRQALRRANRKIRRLERRLRRLKRRGASRWRLRSTKRSLRSAKRSKSKVLRQRRQLRGLHAQHTRALKTAEKQIANHC